MSDKHSFLSEGARTLQAEQGTEALAGAILGAAVTEALDDQQAAFVSRSDFFFVASVNQSGEPTVSYKGGAPGFVRAMTPRRLVFPNYDGNGLFLTMGNLADTRKIGLLFIDFQTPNRLRIQGEATISKSAEHMDLYPGANMVVEVTVSAVFVNCARYIHKHERVQSSPYVPDRSGEQPFPAWKRIDAVQPLLPDRDRGKADEHGGTISEEQYEALLRKGAS